MTDHAKESARATLASIVEMVTNLTEAGESDDHEAFEAAESAIQDDPLSVEIRHGWHAPGQEDLSGVDTEFRILLGTGGPAVQLCGDLDQYNQPVNTVIQYQDWGTPWTTLHGVTEAEQNAMDTYAAQFYYGE